MIGNLEIQDRWQGGCLHWPFHRLHRTIRKNLVHLKSYQMESRLWHSIVAGLEDPMTRRPSPFHFRSWIHLANNKNLDDYAGDCMLDPDKNLGG